MRIMTPDTLTEIGQLRLAAMDKDGVTMHVLSASGPGVDLMPLDQAPELAHA